MSVKTIECETMNPAEFIEGVRKALAGRELGKLATFGVSGNTITVTFSKLGTTELVYDVIAKGSGFLATLKSEKVAFAHRPFRGNIESKLRGVMERCGSKKTV